MTRPIRSVLLFAFAAALVLTNTEPGAAQFTNDDEIRAVRASTPPCETRPDAPWVGRVSGSVETLIDTRFPISFVGCFYEQGECERWKNRASGAIRGIIVQFNCSRRF